MCAISVIRRIVCSSLSLIASRRGESGDRRGERGERLPSSISPLPSSLSLVRFHLASPCSLLYPARPMTFEDLESWQQARQLTREIYTLTRHGVLAKDFGICGQI